MLLPGLHEEKILVLYIGGYLAGTGVGAVSGAVLGALLLGKPPEVLEELHLWDCRINEYNAVCKQNKVAPYIGFGNELSWFNPAGN